MGSLNISSLLVCRHYKLVSGEQRSWRREGFSPLGSGQPVCQLLRCVWGFLLHWGASSAGIICHTSSCQHLLRQLGSSASSRHLLWPLSACGSSSPFTVECWDWHILRTCFPGTLQCYAPVCKPSLEHLPMDLLGSFLWVLGNDTSYGW